MFSTYENEVAAVHMMTKGSVNLSTYPASQDDTVESLLERLAKLEHHQERMRRVNSLARNRNVRALGEMGYSEAQIASLLSPEHTRHGGFFPSYKVKTGAAKIRALKDQLRELDVAAGRDSVHVEESEYTYCEDTTERKVTFQFGAKPDKTVRAALRRHGFTRQIGARHYARSLTTTSLRAAAQLRSLLGA
jgi:hypothetical protein